MVAVIKYDKYVPLWLDKKVSGNRGINHIQVSENVRRYLFEKNANSCQLCGWSKVNYFTGKIPLTVHHIDGNYLNSWEDNLELLCPSCHSLTENYGARNSNGLAQKTQKKRKIHQ